MKISIFGLGALGSNLIVQLAKQFPDFEYVGIDFDKIEDRNIKTQAFFIEQVGLPKVNAIPIIASRFVRKFKYTPVNKKIDRPVEIKNKDELIIDCFDNSASRKFLTRKNDDNVLHIGFSPHYTAEIVWQNKYDVPGDVDPNAGDICSMNDAVSFIHFIVNFSVLTISDFINNGKKNSFIITGKTNIRRL